MLSESGTIEYKREYTDSVKYAVIAFANTDGGKIFIGVDDDGGARGVADIGGVMLKVTNTIRDSIRPDVTLFTDVYASEMADKPVIIIEVRRGTARPYYLAGKGVRPEGVYVRQGAFSVPATETAILNMIRETSGERYECARSILQQLTFDCANVFFARRKLDFGDSQKRTLGLIGEDGAYANLGCLLSDQCAHTIKLAVFEGGTKNVFKDRREFSGSVLNQMEETFEQIDKYNRTRAEFSGLDRLDMRDYPPDAVREALNNAIVHREYAYSAPILISIFDDRMEFVSIGGLARGVTLRDIMFGVSLPRNRLLANVFYRLKLIEAYGTGIQKINECYADMPVKPIIDASDNAFKVVLPNANISRERAARVDISLEREAQVTRLFDERDVITRDEVQAALGVSQGTAILILRAMLDKGALIKRGAGKNTVYRRGK